ncbi:MAG: nickel-dependent lactate racemase [Candidatus Cloacimonetes bacterium]|nr:nickel-dependent lactate racemase [Candidatus Cloacimonadota bacterium]
MILKIPYGKEQKIDVSIDEKHISGVLEPNEVPIGDEIETIKNAIENPINSKNLYDFLLDSKDVLFIVNDATRPTPTARVLDIIYEDIKNFNPKFIVATGIHRTPTEDEYHQIFGKYYEIFKDKIFAHDARKEEDMVYLGKSKNGTEMYINKLGVDADKIVIIGSVEPHYFAGYTGGRKSFLPGIASYKTIEQNHKMALEPNAKSLQLDGNPVHEDMIDALKTIKKEIFAIMTVLDKNHKIYAATSGHINDSFLAAIDKANEVFVVKIKEKADIVLSVVKYPMDIDLYQSQKGIDNAKHSLKEDGILILVSSCRSGIGEEAFIKLLSSCDTPEDVVSEIKSNYVLGYHKAGKMAEVNLRAKVWAVTELNQEILKKIFIKPYKSIQKAVDDAIKVKGNDSKMIVLLDGSVIIPMVYKKCNK